MKKTGGWMIIVGLASMSTTLALWVGGAFTFFPSNSEVAEAFSARHPDMTVHEVTRGDGDEDGVCFLIDYRMRETGAIRRAKWLVYTSGVHYGWKLDSETLENPATRVE